VGMKIAKMMIVQLLAVSFPTITALFAEHGTIGSAVNRMPYTTCALDASSNVENDLKPIMLVISSGRGATSL